MSIISSINSTLNLSIKIKLVFTAVNTQIIHYCSINCTIIYLFSFHFMNNKFPANIKLIIMEILYSIMVKQNLYIYGIQLITIIIHLSIFHVLLFHIFFAIIFLSKHTFRYLCSISHTNQPPLISETKISDITILQQQFDVPTFPNRDKNIG